LTYSSPVLSDLLIINNSSETDGGGIFIQHCTSPQVINCVISDNTSGHSGGGLAIFNSSPLIIDSHISNNTSTDYGGGIRWFASTPTLTGVVINGNSTHHGGGISAWDFSESTLTNVVIFNNSASITGGGIHVRNGSTPSLQNCIVWANTPQQATFDPSFSWNNIIVGYTSFQNGVGGISQGNGSVYWHSGNTETDPEFVNPYGGNFALLESSPCIDSGNPDLNDNGITWENDPDDQDPDGTRMDMGAYYYDQSIQGCTDPLAINYNPDATVDDGSCEYDPWGIVHVPDDFPTIQAAINAASEGDTVLVQPGTYVENINFNGKNILVGSQFIIDSNEAYINQTVIDGNANGLPVVSFNSGETREAILKGLTIQNGFTDSNELGAGIDIRLNNSGPSLLYLNIMDNNSQSGRGGGIAMFFAGSVLIQNCWIHHNIVSEAGGGISTFSSDTLIVSNSQITFNYAEGAGAGIAKFDNTPLLMDHTIISMNIGVIGEPRAAVHLAGPNLSGQITNCTIVNNFTSYGIWQASGESVLQNCIIWNHMIGSLRASGGSIQIDYSLIEGGLEEVFEEIPNILYWGEDNLNIDPMFTYLNDYEYTLQIGSPCIDSGNPDLNDNGITWENDPDDQDPDGTRMDIGAYYFFQIFGCTNPIALNFNPDANVDDGSCIFPVYGCVDSTAYNFNDDADIDDGSCIYYGDVTQDGSIDVIDVITMVGYVLETIQPTPDQIILGDVFTDGELNIFDIVSLIAIIFENEGLMDLTSLTQATLNQHHNTLSFSKTGVIAGVELEYYGDINFVSTPDGWLIEKNENTILMVSLDGSDFNKVHYSGDLKIKSCTVVDWELNKIDAEITVIPDQFSLKPAYPNPFNPTTTIDFTIPYASNVVIKVFDINGNEVAVLFNSLSHAGSHKVVWEASSQSSGLYFVRMVSGDYLGTRKLILLK